MNLQFIIFSQSYVRCKSLFFLQNFGLSIEIDYLFPFCWNLTCWRSSFLPKLKMKRIFSEDNQNQKQKECKPLNYTITWISQWFQQQLTINRRNLYVYFQLWLERWCVIIINSFGFERKMPNLFIFSSAQTPSTFANLT